MIGSIIVVTLSSLNRMSNVKISPMKCQLVEMSSELYLIALGMIIVSFALAATYITSVGILGLK